MLKIVVMPARTCDNPGDDAVLSNIVRYLKGLSETVSITLVSIFDKTDSRYMEEAFEGELQDPLCSRVPAFWGAFPAGHGKLRLAVSFLKGFIHTSIVLLMAKMGRYALRIAPKGRMKPALEAMANADLIVIWSGLNSDPGLKNKLRFWKGLYPTVLATSLRVPVVRFPQTIGPFASKFDAMLARWALNPASLVMVREQKSLEALKELHIIKSQVFVAPDMAFWGIEGIEKESIGVSVSSHITSSSPEITIGLTVRPWNSPSKNPSVVYDQYIAAVEEAIMKLAKRFSPKFLIIQQASGPGLDEDDWPPSELLYKRLKARGIDVQIFPMQNSLKEQVALYRGLSVLIATRMHSTVFSMGWGVPSVMIATRPHRDYGIMQMMGLEKYVIPMDHLTATDICQSVMQILSDKNMSQETLINYQKIQADLSRKLKLFEAFLVNLGFRL